MSEREVHRVEVLSSVLAGGMSTSEAASVLCLSDRQVQRLLKTFCEDGAVSLRQKARSRPPNDRTLVGLRDLTLPIVRQRHADFGPTLAVEKLAERDGVKVSRESRRKWMVEDGLWLSRSQWRVFHRPRLRHECYIEFVQIDGSDLSASTSARTMLTAWRGGELNRTLTDRRSWIVKFQNNAGLPILS